MDHHYNYNYNHNNNNHQWRPPHPHPVQPAIQYQGNPNLCPTCSFSHFPFCPPPPPPQSVVTRPPLPPPYGYPPPPTQNPNWDSHPPSSSSYYSPNPNNTTNNNKRARTDDVEEDERRLKLIRDHGVALSFSNPPPPPPLRDAASAPHHSSTTTATNGYHHHHHQHHHAPSHMDPSRFFSRPPQHQQHHPPLPSSPPPPHSLFPVPFSSSSSPPPPPPEPQQPPPPPPPHPYFHSPQSHHPHHHFNSPLPHPLQPHSPLPISIKTPPPPPPPPHKPKFIDASHLFRHPHRASRPDHFVIILRGLPGSGKTYLAKMLRDLEVENGGNAPRIHSLDDYFMTEVEKVEDSDASKSSYSGRSKKLVTKKVMEYCYEPEMEEAYRSSMLKAFKKTVEEGVFTFIIVDDRNLRVADFAQFWATAKRSGYEVYILDAAYKDPAGCAARNVHGFTLDDIQNMAGQWEEAPSLYLQLDAKSLFHGDDLKESRIQEVDMDMEDDISDALPAIEGGENEKVVHPTFRDDSSSSLKDGKRWDAEGDHPTEVRELGKSKWSEDFGEYDTDQTEGMKGNINALSGLIRQYGKERKSVHWGDEVGNTGFSIGAARKVNALSLVIGPGAGYNLKSNPLPEEESSRHNSVEPKKHSVFQEQIRAELESFKAVFDRRRQRIGGLDVEDD